MSPPQIRGGAGEVETAAILAAIARYEQEVAAAAAVPTRPGSLPRWLDAEEDWHLPPGDSRWQPSGAGRRRHAED